MKFVLFSDLHLDAPFAGLGRDRSVGNRRRQALRDTLRNIVTLTADLKADALLCAGDLYEHESFTDDTMRFVEQEFARLSVPVLIAPGNHDWYGRTSMYQRAGWSANVHVFTDEQFAPVSLGDGVTLWGAAHTRPAGTPGFFESGFRVLGEGRHLALFHGSEEGWLAVQGEGKKPHAPFRAAEIEAAGFAHALVGHYHRARDAAVFTYPGNPCPLSFGEDADRGAVVVTLQPDGTIERERRNVAGYAVHDLRIDVSHSISQQDVRDALSSHLFGRSGCARVDLVGELPSDVELNLGALESARPETLDALVIRSKVRIAYDLDLLAAEQTVRGQFIRDVRAATNLDEETRRLVLVTGLRALDGRKDLEVEVDVAAGAEVD